MTAVLAVFLNHSLTTIPALFALPSMASRSVGVKRTTKETLRVMAFLGRPRVRFLPSISFANFFIGNPPQVYGLRPSGASAVPHSAERGGTVFCIAKK